MLRYLIVLLRRHKLILLSLIFIVTFWYICWRQNSAISCNIDSTLKSKRKFETFILILILTGPSNKDRRDATRETWLRSSAGLFRVNNRGLSHLFVLGTKGLPYDALQRLDKEKSQHQDLILLEDFSDAYEKLTEKLGKSLVWVNDHVSFKYVFKGDDDTFARIDIINNELKIRYDTSPDEMLYLGYFYGKGKVKKSGPWKETEWQLCDMYIPYARGGGYILSYNVVMFVAMNFENFKRYLSEDVSMGSWLAPLEVNRVHDKRFDTEYKTRGCSNTFLVSHKQSIEDMYAKHRSLSNTGKLCEKEFVNFHGYEYDWNVPPSKCCIRKDNIP